MNMQAAIDFLSSLDWKTLSPTLIALASAILLLLTYRSQLKNNKIQVELAEMEKKGKRAEYMPLLEVYTTGLVAPTTTDGFHPYKEKHSRESFSTLPVHIKSTKNSFEIYNIKHNLPESNFFKIVNPLVSNEKKLFIQGAEFVIEYKIDLKKKFRSEEIEGLEKENDIKTDIFYTDMLGNNYSTTFTIIDNNKVKITDTKHLN